MAKAKSDLAPGMMVAGKYRVDRILGKGGMGVVAAATDTKLRRPVAIKVLAPALASDEVSVERFVREGRAAVALTSEHAIRVYDVGELPSGAPFMVMELLVGRDLQRVLDEQKRLPSMEAVDYILQAIEALGEAHALGMVHRDLKPANLFLTRRSDGTPLVKVLDFGLAKAAPAPGEKGLTSSAAAIGTPQYMSPEQLRGTRDVDARTDIWALGASLYELVTGTSPFDAGSVADLIPKILRDAPKPPHTVLSEVPHGLSRVIQRCLEKNAHDRYANVAELAAALEPWASPDAIGTAQRVERVLSSAHVQGAVRDEGAQRGDETEPDREATTERKVVGETASTVEIDTNPTNRGRALTRWVLGAGAAIGLAALGGAAIKVGTQKTATHGPPPVAASPAPTPTSSPLTDAAITLSDADGISTKPASASAPDEPIAPKPARIGPPDASVSRHERSAPPPGKKPPAIPSPSSKPKPPPGPDPLHHE
jgi:serine/threonine-protein kinase